MRRIIRMDSEPKSNYYIEQIEYNYNQAKWNITSGQRYKHWN